MKAKKKCQNQTALAGVIELTDNDLESIVGGADSPGGHWMGVSDSKGTRQVWVVEDKTTTPTPWNPNNAMQII